MAPSSSSSSSSSSSVPFQKYPSTGDGVCSPPSASAATFELAPSWERPTDIWRKPGSKKVEESVFSFNAPLVYKQIRLAEFGRARVTIMGQWERLYDQGGLVLVLPSGNDDASTHETSLSKNSKWVKAGVEFEGGKPWIGVVACEKWADWSLFPLDSAQAGSVTIELERTEQGDLHVNIIGEKGDKSMVREVTWVFDDENETKEQEAWIGVYSATPKVEGRGEKDGLVVGFEGWELEIL